MLSESSNNHFEPWTHFLDSPFLEQNNVIPQFIENIVIVTDAWEPQINGVVTTLKNLLHELQQLGIPITLITPEGIPQVSCPRYPEIKLALFPNRRVETALLIARPKHVFIATEGPLGYAARHFCTRHQIPFTTAYTTRYPEYLAKHFGIPEAVTYAYLRRFHSRSQAVLVSTPSMIEALQQQGFSKLTLWSRGVDTNRFAPERRNADFQPQSPGKTKETAYTYSRPFLLYVGRVSCEKNIEAFLNLDLQTDIGLPSGQGTKMIVGEGPQYDLLRLRYPDAVFMGSCQGESLAQIYAASDVFVFPSKTDTFGLVMLEALASGVPVAAYPVPGPLDILGDAPQAGCLNPDLATAIRHALTLQSADCRRHAAHYSWRACALRWLETMTLNDPYIALTG